MKMMKKILTLILVLAVIATVAAVPAMAEETDNAVDNSMVDPVADEVEATVETVDESAAGDAVEAAEPVEEAAAVVQEKTIEIAATGEDIDPPVIKNMHAVKNGVQLKFTAITGAAKYRIFYKNGSSWAKLGDTTALTYTDTTIKVGQTRTYTVRAIGKNGSYISKYNTNGFTKTLLANPKVSQLTPAYANNQQGIKVTWDKVSGAAVYRVYVSTSATSGWKTVGDVTTNACFYNGSMKSGTKYYFTVRCISASKKDYDSFYNTGVGTTFVSIPTNVKITNDTAGQKISWSASAGASKYRVFVKLNGKWAKVADTTATSCVYAKVVSGESYTYTVRCMNANGSFVSTYNPAGYTKTYLSTPVLKKIENSADSIHLVWGEVAGACGYRIYAFDGEKWVVGFDTEYNEAYIGATSGYDYQFTVRALNEKGAVDSGFDKKGLEITYIDPPKLTQLEPRNNGYVYVMFNTSSSIVGIRYFVSENGGPWKKLEDVYNPGINFALYTFKNADPEVTYRFTAREITSDGKYRTGYYSNTEYPFRYTTPTQTVFDRETAAEELNAYGVELGLILDESLDPFTGNGEIVYDVFDPQIYINCGDVTQMLIDNTKILLEDYAAWVEEYAPDNEDYKRFLFYSEGTSFLYLVFPED